MARKATHIAILDRDARPKWTACGYSREWIARNPRTIVTDKPPTCTLCLAYQKRTGDGPESMKALLR